MSKLTLKSYDGAIYHAAVIIGFEFIRGFWTLTGYWNTDEYFRFETLRILIPTILIIRILNFVAKKIPSIPRIQNLVIYIQFGEGILCGTTLLALPLADPLFRTLSMIAAIALLILYIVLLVALWKRTYNKTFSISYFKAYVISVICVNFVYINIGFIYSLTKENIVLALQYFFACIPPLALTWYFSKMKKVEADAQKNTEEKEEWRPE